MKPEDFDKPELVDKRIWEIRDEVHKGIGPAREEAYALSNSKWVPFWRSQRKAGGEPPPAIAEDDIHPPRKANESLEDWALGVEKWAVRLQQQTEAIGRRATVRDLLEVTSRAGRMLGATEDLMGVRSKATQPSLVRKVTMTVVATARDQLTAAKGLIKNLRAGIGVLEWAILACLISGASIVYAVFHPSLGLNPAPIALRPYYEIVFWSIAGAIAVSIITVAEETKTDRFDPRHYYKYFYRIPMAPLFAYIAILFVNLLGRGAIADGGGLPLDLTNVDYPLLIVLSFVFGFYAKRTLDLINFGATKILPSSQSQPEAKVPEE